MPVEPQHDAENQESDTCYSERGFGIGNHLLLPHILTSWTRPICLIVMAYPWNDYWNDEETLHVDLQSTRRNSSVAFNLQYDGEVFPGSDRVIYLT